MCNFEVGFPLGGHHATWTRSDRSLVSLLYQLKQIDPWPTLDLKKLINIFVMRAHLTKPHLQHAKTVMYEGSNTERYDCITLGAANEMRVNILP